MTTAVPFPGDGPVASHDLPHYTSVIMFGQRLYYDDAYRRHFDARVVEYASQDGKVLVVLDQTCFYPTSGGQPHDFGTIDGVEVTDVSVRVDDGAVLHTLARELEADRVSGQIDWRRRYDHMQQHTGQHILSSAFVRTAEAETVSFHLSPESVTIDLDMAELLPAQLQQVEDLANEVVWQNRPVQVRYVSQGEVQAMPLRRMPVNGYDRLRLIDIEDFDLSACGGTHVAHTGEVGLIKIVRVEKRRGQVRVEFRCGRRALQDYRQKNQVVNELMSAMTTGVDGLVTGVQRLQTNARQMRRQAKKLQADLLRLEADRLVAGSRRHGDLAVITSVLENREANDLRALGNQLVRNEGVIALLGLSGERSALIFCRSDEAPGDMNALMKSVLSELGPASGGGRAAFAQGGGPAASLEQVSRAIQQAYRQLLGEIS